MRWIGSCEMMRQWEAVSKDEETITLNSEQEVKAESYSWRGYTVHQNVRWWREDCWAGISSRQRLTSPGVAIRAKSLNG